MTEAKFWNIAKWPFLLVDAVLLVFAGILVWHAHQPITHTEAGMICAFIAVGALVGVLPFILEYRAFLKVVEVNALGTAVEQIQAVEKIGAQIFSVTDQWTRMQEATERYSTLAITGSREIAEKMSAEVREFSEFMQKMNDSEKSAMRLEIEKGRRAEGEWLQVLVRIFDHIYALHNAAARSGQPELAAQISNFQNACCTVARRMGLAMFEAERDKPFDPKSHQLPGKETAPEGALVAETVGAGYTYQGRLLRPALVRLKAEESSTGENLPSIPDPADVE
jgi:molecular chaperone GrpE (heat shock protein)